MKLLLATMVVLFSLTACSSSGDAAGNCDAQCQTNLVAANAPSATWSKDYQHTTCGDWLNQMTPDEQMTASRDLIRRLGAKDTSDDFASDFIGDISTACKGSATISLSDVAASLATIDTDDFN